MNFWKQLKKPFFVLAPMADVTDMAFRQIVVECGKPDVFYTEFVSAAGLCSEKGRPKLLPHLKFGSNERPIVAQLFGSNPKHFYECSKLVSELGFDGIDINMGCPDRKVLKQGAGIALSKTPELAAEIIAETKRGAHSALQQSSGQASSGQAIPVSIKTRLGFSKVDISWLETILKCDIAVLTVHLRTMKEMSKIPAHWELASEISKIAHTYNTLVVGNGDVASYEEGINKAKQFNLDGIMIGRAVFGNPWIFSAKGGYAFGGNLTTKTPEERITLLKHHISNFINLWGLPPAGGKNYNTMRRFFKVYINGFEGAKELRDKLMQTKSPQETLALLE